MVKAALYALCEMQKSAESWTRSQSKWHSFFQRGHMRRQTLRLKCLGLVFHDRILAGRPIERRDYEQQR